MMEYSINERKTSMTQVNNQISRAVTELDTGILDLNVSMTVFRQGRTLLDQGCPNFDENFFGASVHEKIEI